MTLQTNLIITGCVLALLAGSHIYAYRSGWSAHADKINNEAREKKDKADKAVSVPEEKAAKADDSGKQKTKIIYRTVIQYVQDPNRVTVKYDADRVRIKQSAIDNASNIPGFDDEAVPAK